MIRPTLSYSSHFAHTIFIIPIMSMILARLTITYEPHMLIPYIQ
jgi:hypothetical protein